MHVCITKEARQNHWQTSRDSQIWTNLWPLHTNKTWWWTRLWKMCQCAFSTCKQTRNPAQQNNFQT